MKSILHYCLMLCMVLTACTEKENIQKLDEYVITSAKLLQSQSIDIPDSLNNAKDLFVYKDSILIVVNKKYDYFIELYNLNTGKLFSKAYHFGEGIDQLLSADVHLNGNMLIINDSVKPQIAVLNIEDVLRGPEKIAHPLPYSRIGIPKAILFHNEILTENPDYFHNKEMRIQQGNSRFLVMKQGETYTESKNYKYFTKDLSVNGQLIANEEKGRVLYANLYESIIEVYDSNLSLIKKVTGPVETHPKYRFKGDEGYYRIVFKQPIPYAYINSYADSDYVYLLYAGKSSNDKVLTKGLVNWILKFDWDGNWIESYRLNRPIQTISKGKHAFYATVLDDLGNPELVMFVEE